MTRIGRGRRMGTIAVAIAINRVLGYPFFAMGLGQQRCCTWAGAECDAEIFGQQGELPDVGASICSECSSSAIELSPT